YFVPTPVCEGSNRVALPTSFLASARRTETEVLSFQSNDAGAGEVVVPETIIASKFPGAKSVCIKFDADQRMRDEFWLPN
ncbi:MAG: J domain-containing protein, partial [Ruegeria sp.]|nr:J domain-containing protein [Ruegeria sp.]